MKSIMHQKDGTCYLCMKLNQDYSVKPYTEEHHCINGNGRRPLSEKYGLKVYLCREHHTIGEQAVHQNAEIAAVLKDDAQRAFEKHFPDLNFMAIFSKNYKMGD